MVFDQAIHVVVERVRHAGGDDARLTRGAAPTLLDAARAWLEIFIQGEHRPEGAA